MSGPEPEDSPPRAAGVPRPAAAWEILLGELSGASRSHAGAFIEVRGQLVRFFVWRGSAAAEDLADETLERVAQKLATGEPIADVRKYLVGVARLVALETARRAVASPAGAPSDEECAPAGDAEDRLHALEQCLGKLPQDERALLLAYLDGDGQDRIQKRKELAKQRAIAAGALRLRAHRLRLAVEHCVKGKLGGGPSAGRAARPVAGAMTASAIGDDDLRALLLGELSEADANRVEDAVFSDEASLDAFACVEDDLLDAWAQGELAGDARTRFEARLAASPDGRERLATARALATLVRARATADVTTPAAIPPAAIPPAAISIEARRDARSLRLRAQRTVIAVTALAAAAMIAVYLARESSPGGPQIVVIALGPQIVRDGEAAVSTVPAARAAGARVRFELVVDNLASGALSVVVQGRAGDVARAAARDDRGRVWAEVDAAALAPGRYRVVLRQAGADGAERDVAAYDVHVVEP